jgi:hypothetical protein
VPDKLGFDGSKEQTEKKAEFQQQIRKNNIQQHVSEPDMHNQSPVLERYERNGTESCSERSYRKYSGIMG